ncbi:MAG: hypothetical protein ACHQJX_01840 [Candidatus Acidiferrales bacterium]
MKKRISRRDLLKTGLAAGASSLVLPTGNIAAVPPPAVPVAAGQTGAIETAPPEGSIVPLTSSSDVNLPPRGRSFFKFSFDFPEPSVSFQGMFFSFRLYTFENAYGLDRDHLTVEKTASGITFRCSQFVWAGDQQKIPGTLLARIRKNGEFVEWDVSAEMDQPIKSISAIVRGVPRGQISSGAKASLIPKITKCFWAIPSEAATITPPSAWILPWP